MPDNRYYYFKDAKGNRHTVNKAAFDNDREGFAKAFPGARMEVIDRKTGRRGDVDVKDAGRVGDFGAHLFTGQTVRREKYQPKTSLGKAALRVAQKKWGKEESGAEPGYASLGLTKPLAEGGKESALVKGLREADALKRRDEEQMPIDYTKPSAVKQMAGRTRREQQTLERRMEQAGREAGKDVMKPLREKEARLKTPVVDTGDANVNAHVINTQEQAERQLAESGLEFANKHLDDYVSDNILNEFKTATTKGAAAESALSKASPFAYMAAGKAYNEALDPDKLLKHLQEKANADIAKVLSQPKMQEEIGLKAAAYGISPEEYVEKSLIPGLQAKLAADFDKSELSRSMPKSTAEYILRGVNESMLGTIMSMGMTSKKQRQYAQQGMAMTDNGENPDVNPGMAARVARGTLGFVADAPVFGAAGKAGAAVAGKVFGNGVAQTARIANSTLGGRIARMAGSGMVSQGITGVLYGSTNAAVQNYSTGDDTSIGNTVKVMAMGGLSEGASWATMGGIGGAVGAGIYNVSGVKRIPAKAFQLAMEGIGMHIGGNVAKTIEGHDTDWTSIEGNLEACANVVALKLTHARLPKRQSKDGIKESYLDMVARNINGLMTSDGQRAAFGGYTFTNEEKEQLFGSASAPKRNESIYGYDAHNNPLTRKESLTSWAMRAKKTAAKGKGEESYKDTDAEFVKTAYDEIMADNTIPWDTKAKFSALVMGTVPSARPMMENCRIEGGSVNEYSKNGELLSKNSFKSIDERNSIIYSLNMKREDQRLSNAYGAAQIKDEKTAQATLEAVAEANGMTAEQLKAAMDKQPLRRSDEEQNACVALRKAYEDEQFVPGTLHAEQSNTEGKDVVEENGLGTETPNNEAASEVLGDLTKTEDALQAAMDSNDVLKEEYERMQKAGMSNPQIYMELFNAGLTQEQLAPLADYINALSKAQGMFKGTQDKIVETTQKHVGQWSYKGELNGEKQNGEQMVFVKDDKGRVLIVGAGDVAFDGEGRVRDGDMLTVYDPATREMDFVHAKDVTLERTTSSEEYAKDYQRQLEELNSTVYAEMQQQDGKPNEASLSQTKPGEQPVGEEGNEALPGLSKPTEPVGEKETTPVGEEPVATLADGTPVPMMKDSKGRETADYSQMSPEQGAEWMSSQFGENAEAAVDGQIKRAEKTLKDVEKLKVDYTGDLNDAKEAEAQKTMAVDAAKKELELYTNIKKAMTEKKVKAGMEKVSSVGGVGEVGSVGSVGVAREKFESGLRVVGNKRTRTLADGSKLRGHYEIVEADSLTPSHNANDGYKKSEGFPVNEEGRTINDRDYENDKQAQLVTDMIAMKYDGQAVDQVPVVTSDGIVVDGNGRTMAGQKAAKNGTDIAYLEALKENAENYGFTAEQIEQSGLKHPRLVLVSDEPMKYDTATFAKFNKNEKKAQGNTQQAVANSKKLSADEIGAIVSEIEGSGSLDAFFNNPSAINSLLTRLVDKGVIGLNEVAGLREGEDKLSAAGKDFVKNLLLGSVFSENTIRMMGADAMLKTKALNGIRAVTDNMKLGDYALMKEIDKAVQLLYEARQGGSGVDAYLRTPAMFGENAADRFDPISQAIALALEGKVEDFRELMMAYNRNAAPYADANQTEMFGERPTNEEFIKEFLKLRNWEDYETRHSSKEGNGDAGSSEGTEPQARGGNVVTSEADYNKAVERLREAKGEERERILDQMGEYVKEFAKSNGYDEPVVLRTKKDLVDAAEDPEEKSFIENMQEGEHYPGYYENGKIHIYLEGSTGSKELRETFIHESVHADNDTDPSRVESLVYSITDMNTLTRRDLESVIEKLVHATHYTDEARKLPEDEALHMLADEALAHLVEYAQRNGIRAISEITNNPTLLNVAEKAFKERENDRRRKEGLDSRGDTEQGKNIDVIPAKKDSGTHVKNTEGESGNIGLGSTDKGSRNNEGQRDVDKVEEEKSDKPHEASLSLTEPGEPTEPKGEKVAILPKKEENTLNPIVKAAENYKKDHPLTEGEIRSSDVDDIAKDMAVDYLNGEVTDDLHRAVYESIYEKVKDAKMKNATKQADDKTEATEAPKVEASASPIEGMKNAAEKFAKEKEAATEAMGEENKPQQKADDAAVEASNKKVNDLWNDLLKAGREDLSASFIGLNARQLEVLPKLVSAMAENAYLRIKRGMHNLEDVVKEMRKEFAPAAQVFKKEDVDAIYEQMMNIRYRDGEQRMSLKEWADYYEKSSPKHKEELVGDSKTAEERKQAEKKYIDAVKLQLAFGRKIKSIIELRKIAERHGLKDIKDTDLQELAEVAIVMKARGIASSESTNDAVKFERIKKLYENQPSLNQRDSERVMKQQYSTPAPYAFLADMYVKAGMEVKSALEPSAGNGMLTIGLPKDAVHVNDIDAQRLANLQRQGFKNVTSQDGTQPFADKDVDVVVTNPPFGSATPRDYDGYTISSLEGQMAINALESMKDNGRAAIIIGGKTEYAKNGSLNPKDKALLGFLYSHYNVEDVINVDGSLYAKQGTTYPTRIILINGRRFDENAYPPVKDKARAEAVKSYDELYKRINDDILRSGRMDSPVGEGGEDANAKPNRPSVADVNEEGVRAGGNGGGEQKPSVRTGGVHDKTAEPVSDNVLGTEGGTKPGENGGLPDGAAGANGAGTEPASSKEPITGANKQRGNEPGGNGRPNTQPNADETTDAGNGGRPRGQLERVDRPVRGLSAEKVTYAPRSENPFTLKAVMPADQQEAVNKNLEKLGDADQFLVEELGYNDKADLYAHLAAEQVDSVALALQQAKKGNAFIIGDMTGIGKGRQAASLIRYAKKQGQVPVYFTKTAGLLSDVYRDLVDIGSKELRPFVFGSAKEAAITDADGNVVFALPSKNEVKRVLDYIEKNGELPKEYDYVLTTYSQVSNGVYEFDENGNRKERKLAKGKKFGAAAISGQARRDAIEKLMKNGYLILDESHTAGGDSGQGNYFQHIIQKAKNVTFFSATFAKRPDNMPIYALRTAMNQGGLKASDLIDAVKRGGATLQEIMSQALTQCGQMIRRERDMTGVTIDWKAIDDPEVVAEQREQYDSIIGLFNDIINFQRTYVSAYVDRRNEELAEVQSSMGIKRGTEALGIKNQPFASKAFNTVQQVLLSLKAKSAAERAIDYLKQGMKPVIALNNTNESQTGNLALGEEMDAPDLGTSLKKGLEGTLRYTSKNAKDESESGYINLSDLGADAVEAYHALEEKITKTSTGLSLSPIDVIKNELTKAGYKVGELTGRQTEFVYNENGTVTKVKRADTDKKKLAREFNDGQIDALILNKSAATGISLHASSKYADQRKRVMIVAQQQLDVNDEVQMRGRIDRTGQVARGAYEYVVSLIPAEQRLLMMFKAKLKSLDANTTSSQKSKFNEMEVADITNKYGDKVVKEYMAEHLDLYARMADPFGWEKSYGADLSAVDPQKLVASSDGMSSEAGGDASKLLGRMALLKVKEQEKMLQEIGDLYAAEIQRLNEMGENDLEITELPLKAKTINKGIWKEGSEPGGNNAFADNTYVEKVNMAVLKKPMKAEEVKKAQDGLTGGKSWDEYRTEKIAATKEYFDNKIAEATQKYEERAVKAATKAKEKYIKEAKKGQKENGMSDEQIEKMAGYQYESIYSDEKTKLDEVVKNLKAKYGVFERALETFNTEDAFVLPTDMNNPAEVSGFGNSYGRLIDIKITDNFSTNASTISFATLDGRRKITFPINGKVGLGSDKADVIGIIDRLTRQASAMGDKHLRVLSMDASNWDKLTSNESRKDGYIITGNLLQALIDTKEQGLGGQLVKYTTDTGEVKTGILMPEKFEPNGLANEKPINSVAEKFELPSNKGGITEITSSDEDVKIAQGFDYMKMARNYTIRVPKSNKKGGKYFLDKELLKMVDGGNFETRGNTMLAEIKADKLKDVLDRLSELGVKVREESGVHYRTEHGDASLGLSKPLEGRIAETVEKVSKQTGGKVKMVNSVEEIGNGQVRRDIENGKQVTGWYDENTGEVHLYMPNIHDSYTAEKTVWHETVGHEGMRGLLGDKFKDYMRGLWMDLDNPVNAELRAYVKERMGKDAMGFYDAIEEFIAESAEKGKGEPGFWNYIKNKVTDALHEIGYRISPNVKDVKYMLWLAKNVQKKSNDPWWKMRADAVKWKIEHENVEYTKIHGGEFYENDGKNHDFEDMTKEEWDEATDGQIHYRTAPSAATALDRYHSMLNAHGYMATEAFMDNMLSLEKLMKAVDPSIKKIEDVKSSMNPYVLQNTMQGAMSDKMTLFEHQVMKPLDKAMSDVLDSFAGKNTEEKIRECNLYMIGKHGLERNRVLFVRDWFRKMEKTEDVDDAGLDNLDKIWKGERSDLRRKLDSGQIDLREYYRQMDEWIVQNIDKDFKAEEHDYSGMHGLQEIDDLKSPYDDAGAIDSVMSQEAKMENQKKGSVDNLWNRIKDATNYSINSDYENGLMSEELRDRVASMFDWYVPLRKFDEATAEDVYGYISGEDGKGFIGETLMNAKGRKSLSDVNVLAQIGAMGNRAIRNGGQNAVKQAFARFVRNSGMQNLVKETKVWVEKKGTDMNGNDIWEEAYPQIPDNASAHDIAAIVDAFETDMKTKQAKGEAKTLSNSTDIGFKFARAKNKSEHFVDVKIAGRTHRFVVMGNPRAAQALNGMLENSSPKNALLKGLKSTTRFMAQMATSYSPEFVMRNIIRDAEFASSNVTAKEGVRYGLKWARYYAELNPVNVFYNEGAGALKSLKWKDLKEGVGIGLYARYREGTLGDSKMERYFKEFMQNGGETGWVQVKTMQEWEKEYKHDVSRERSNVSKAGKMLRDVLVGNVENLNEMAENMARFATFCTSRDLGRSAVRSAYDAKQVSTNFNRHGSGDAIKTFKNGEMGAGKEMRRNVYGTIASYLRNYSMFFNAGVQSTHLLMNNVKKAPVGTIASMMAMPFGLGILAAAVNNAMIANEDEKERKGVQDPYGELPEYIRRNNLCIYKGGGKFVTIPLAIELRAFYGLGDIAAGMTTAKNVKSTRNVAMDAVGCMSQLLPVVDFTNTSAFDKEPGKETLKGVLPTAAAPFVEWWLNSDWKGSPIRREGDYTENRPAWMNAYSGTPEKLMDLNKWVNARTNDVAPGNENMRGNSLLDEATDPAMLNHIIGTIGGGAATFMTRGTGLVLKYADGREQEIETKDIPFLRSLMYTPSEQTSMARTKAKWYSYKESMEKNMSNYSMLKNKNVPLTERIRNAADRHRFEQGTDYARIRIIKDAEKQMKRWNKMKRLNADDKKQVDFANKNIEMIMQKAVEQMDGISEE
ncbi:LPD38 domain-containing protein [uncultured Prevotella sp.]|jgi:hypothetical protein|uniref:LPD38 domain-containing protein n=1 Tax=uncultured Prevotella sp. TaxID=159272 RepID=UPI0025CD2C9E|nr:LPD38 domain-containing protein [uncultured Prevotella sp.]